MPIPTTSAMTRTGAAHGVRGSRSASALSTLAPLVSPASRPHLAAATTALDQFIAVNAQIVALSRRNTNVRSLALSLTQKRPLIAACEETLRALQDAIGEARVSARSLSPGVRSGLSCGRGVRPSDTGQLSVSSCSRSWARRNRRISEAGVLRLTPMTTCIGSAVSRWSVRMTSM